MSSFDDALAQAGDGGFLAKVLGIAYALTRFKQYASEVKAVKGTRRMHNILQRKVTTSSIMNSLTKDEEIMSSEYKHCCSLKENQNCTCILM